MIEEHRTNRAQQSVLRAVYNHPLAPNRFGQTGLLPPEAMILIGYSGDFVHKRVLDVGIGAGRTTGYLVRIADRYLGIDYSEMMVRAARQRYPNAPIEQRDVRHLDGIGDGSFDAVFSPAAVLDALSHTDRLKALHEIHRVLVAGGLFAFSGHNREWRRFVGRPRMEWSKDPVVLGRGAVRWLSELRNWYHHRDLGYQCDEYEIANDAAFEWRALHYYISRDAQIQQLRSVGFETLECLSMDGSPATEVFALERDYKLHYVCRASTAPSRP